MKKNVVIGIGIIVLVIIVIVGGYFLLNKSKCTASDSSKCDKSCKIDNDCKGDALCSCINTNENMKNPSNLRADCEQFDCKCINNICTAK